MKYAAATASIASRLAKKRRKAPPARSSRPDERQSPTVASGGTMAVAIATPGSAGLTRLSASANAPASPEATATITS